MDQELQSLILVCLGVTLLFLNLLRVSGQDPRFALKDNGGDLLIPRSFLHLFAWFLILAAVLLIRYGIVDPESMSRLLTSAAFAFVGVIMAVSLVRLLRRFALTDQELSDVGRRYKLRIPLAAIRSAEVGRFWGVLPVLVITQHDGTRTELWALDFAVTPQSVATAIRNRIPTVRRFVP